MIFNILIYYS